MRSKIVPALLALTTLAGCSPPTSSRVEVALIAAPSSMQADEIVQFRSLKGKIDGTWRTLARSSLAVHLPNGVAPLGRRVAAVMPPSGRLTEIELELAARDGAPSQRLTAACDAFIHPCAAGLMTLQLDNLRALKGGKGGIGLRVLSADTEPGTCGGDEDAAHDAGPVASADAAVVPDPACTDVICPPGEVCRAGLCAPQDPCANVICPPGEVCQDGICAAPPPDLSSAPDLSSPPDLAQPLDLSHGGCDHHASCGASGPSCLP